jgi:hypothetical protein
MSWNKISVWQYQQMHPIITNPPEHLTEFELECKLVGIVNNLTDNQVLNLPKEKLNKYRSEIIFLKDNYEGTPVNRVRANGRTYRFIQDAKDINASRYIESKYFCKELIPNLHKIAASITIPQQRKWLKYIDLPYDSDKHQEYANDFLFANFKEVYYSVVFFYQVFNDWTPITQDFLEKSLIKENMEQDKAQKVAAILWNILGGNTVPK